jgi:hypothetical protein
VLIAPLCIGEDVNAAVEPTPGDATSLGVEGSDRRSGLRP